jgi:hypothetical protein
MAVAEGFETYFLVVRCWAYTLDVLKYITVVQSRYM